METRFDFPRWRPWIESKVTDWRAGGFVADLRLVEQQTPAWQLYIESGEALAELDCWKNFVDYYVLDLRSNTLVATKLSVEVSDETFEGVYDTFIAEFRKLN